MLLYIKKALLSRDQYFFFISVYIRDARVYGYIARLAQLVERKDKVKIGAQRWAL